MSLPSAAALSSWGIFAAVAAAAFAALAFVAKVRGWDWDHGLIRVESDLGGILGAGMKGSVIPP